MAKRRSETVAGHTHITRRERFSATRRIPRRDDDSGDRGSLVGHNFAVDVTVEGEISDRTGMVVNLQTVGEIVQREIIDHLDGCHINDCIPLFRRTAPTLENMSGWIVERLLSSIPHGRLHGIRLAENDRCFVEREVGRDTVLLTRVFHFCAAHRLHETGLSDEENRKIFGRCNNPGGHGHNYLLEVTVSGNIDRKSGLVADIEQIDSLVGKRILDQLDHTNLNTDVADFHDLNPTAENIACVIWDRLDCDPGGAKLYRIRLRETERNWVEYFGS